jgi:DNA-binding MarR family transcriptional regulator
MDPKDLRTLKILEKVDQDNTASQRALARDLGISLGLVNSFIKRLAKKGYFKVMQVPKNRIRYILTPRGVAEKSRLTYEYIQHSYQFYKDARKKLRNLYNELENKGLTRIVFYGASDLAEIAYVSLLETNIRLVAVVDDEKIGRKFMRYTVMRPAHLEFLAYDIILITSINSSDPILHKISSLGIASENVVQIG